MEGHLSQTDDELILLEVRDHAKYWRSDIAKRQTVEKHLTQKGMKDVTAKIDRLIADGKLILIPKRLGDYVKDNDRSIDSNGCM